jgi:phosphoglycerate dehydrogenase-like enzyme
LVRIAVLDDYQNVAYKLANWSSLPHNVELKIFSDHIFDENGVVERLKDFEIVSGMRERTPFGRSLLERLPNLQLLITTSTINRAFDLEAAADLGIVVEGTDDSSGGSGLSDLTWGLVTALTMNILKEDRAVREGKWQVDLATSLGRKTLGLVGLGGLGSRLAEIGRAFRMDIITWSQNMNAERAAECGATLVTKDELFSRSDVVTINYVLSKRSVDLVGARELSLMKPTAYLVNTSRGFIVNEAALIDALERKAIAGAGIDTFDQEPLPLDHPFRRLDNVIVTPHIGYVTRETYAGWFPQILENIQAFLKGDYLRVMNPAVLSSAKLRGPGRPNNSDATQSSKRVEKLPTSTYEAVQQAIINKDQVIASYNGQRMELCPHIIGTKNGRERALFYMFSDSIAANPYASAAPKPDNAQTTSGMGASDDADNWICIFIDSLTLVWTRRGPWHSAPTKSRPRDCIDEIDVEVTS